MTAWSSATTFTIPGTSATTTTTTTTQPPATTTTTQAPLATINTVDPGTRNRWLPSMAIGTDGNPVISFRDNWGQPVGGTQTYTGSAVKVAACANPTCSTATISTVDGGAGGSGRQPIVIGNDGNPIMAYLYRPDPTSIQDAGLKVAACSNPTCTASTSYWIDPSPPWTGLGASIVIGNDGNPVIAYYGSGVGLKVAACTNTTCAHNFGGVNASIHTPDSAGKSHTSVVITSTHPTQHWPFVVYWRSTNELGTATCWNPRCEARGSDGTSSWSSPWTGALDSVSANGTYSSVAVNTLGRPVISYYDADNGDLKVIVCASVVCGGGTGTISTLDSGGDVGWYTSVAVRSNNLPVISYYDITNGKLKVAECTDVNCTNATIKTIGDADPAGTSIAIGNDGTPIVAYIDNHDLKVAVVPVG